MAVAETSTTTPETITRNPQQQLALRSLFGAAYLLFCFWLVFSGLPTLWRELDLYNTMHESLAWALLLVVTVLVLAAEVIGYSYLYANNIAFHERGARAGSFLTAVAVVGILLLALLVVNLMHPQGMGAGIEAGIFVILLGGLLYGLYYLFTLPAWGALLGRLEDSGWFDLSGFKPNQGVRVRRGTVIGILTLVVCGLYVLVQHHTLANANWDIPVPFLGEGLVLPMMYQVNITVLLVIAAVSAWLAWRIVNWPTFADFLIATEAELNKVSWTTRKRLLQDTVVVLVTVVLFTVFLFAVDILWVYVLSNPFVRVLHTNPIEERQKQNQPTAW